MKTIKIKLITILFSATTFSANAQPKITANRSATGSPSFAKTGAIASANVSVTIISPISISKIDDMNFENIAVNGAGSVILTPTGTRANTGGVTLPQNAGTVSAASFIVYGTPDYTFSITLPTGATTIYNNSGDQMTVDSWTSNPISTGTLNAGGKGTFTVGATLHVSGNQVHGTYVSAPFEVTVNYN